MTRLVRPEHRAGRHQAHFWPPPSPGSRRRRSSEHGMHRGSRPGPAAKQETASAQVRPAPDSSKVGPSPYDARARQPAQSTAGRGTAPPSVGVSGGREAARPPRWRARTAEPPPFGLTWSARLVRARRLRAPLRTSKCPTGRARRPRNGPPRRLSAGCCVPGGLGFTSLARARAEAVGPVA